MGAAHYVIDSLPQIWQASELLGLAVITIVVAAFIKTYQWPPISMMMCWPVVSGIACIQILICAFFPVYGVVATVAFVYFSTVFVSCVSTRDGWNIGLCVLVIQTVVTVLMILVHNIQDKLFYAQQFCLEISAFAAVMAIIFIIACLKESSIKKELAL